MVVGFPSDNFIKSDNDAKLDDVGKQAYAELFKRLLANTSVPRMPRIPESAQLRNMEKKIKMHTEFLVSLKVLKGVLKFSQINL